MCSRAVCANRSILTASGRLLCGAVCATACRVSLACLAPPAYCIVQSCLLAMAIAIRLCLMPCSRVSCISQSCIMPCMCVHALDVCWMWPMTPAGPMTLHLLLAGRSPRAPLRGAVDDSPRCQPHGRSLGLTYAPSRPASGPHGWSWVSSQGWGAASRLRSLGSSPGQVGLRDSITEKSSPHSGSAKHTA